MLTATSVQDREHLQQDLSKKNMLFSKDLIELTKVIGQGKCLSVCMEYYDLDTEGLISKVS